MTPEKMQQPGAAIAKQRCALLGNLSDLLFIDHIEVNDLPALLGGPTIRRVPLLHEESIEV